MGKINDMVKDAHETAVQHGWWDKPPEFGTLIALCHSELSEALEEYRKGKEPTETYYREDGKPEGIPSELADTVIRRNPALHIPYRDDCRGRSYMLDTGEKYDNKATDHQPAVVTCHRPEITAERDWQQNPGRYRKRN